MSESKENEVVESLEKENDSTAEQTKTAFGEFIDKLFSGGKSKEGDMTSEDTSSESAGKPEVNKPLASFTQEDLDKAVADAKEEWKAEQEEKKRVEKLTPEEQEKERYSKTEKENAELKQQILERNLKDEAIAALEKEGYPVHLADLLSYSDKENMEQSLKLTQEVFKESLELAIKERMKGKTPAGLGGAGSDGYKTGDELIKAQIAKNIRGGN